MHELAIGAQAPHFSLKDQDAKSVSLIQFKGTWVILYFYPRDDTPGCTIEAKDFSSGLHELEHIGAVVLGISKDSVESHKKFQKKHKLKITLLSDPDHTMIESYGVWQPKKFIGKEFLGIVRTTYIIDPKGTIAAVFANVRAKGHVHEVKEKLVELQSNPIQY